MVQVCYARDDRGLSGGGLAPFVPDVGTSLPIRTKLLGVRCPGDHALRYEIRDFYGSEAPNEM
jgi:hypothetical protein